MRRYRELLQCVCLWTACCLCPIPRSSDDGKPGRSEALPHTSLMRPLSPAVKGRVAWFGRYKVRKKIPHEGAEGLFSAFHRLKLWGNCETQWNRAAKEQQLREGGGSWGNACLVLCVLATVMEAMSSRPQKLVLWSYRWFLLFLCFGL